MFKAFATVLAVAAGTCVWFEELTVYVKVAPDCKLVICPNTLIFNATSEHVVTDALLPTGSGFTGIVTVKGLP